MKDAATPIGKAYQRIEDERETQRQVERGGHDGAWGPGVALNVVLHFSLPYTSTV
jgi:hypothetical protein